MTKFTQALQRLQTPSKTTMDPLNEITRCIECRFLNEAAGPNLAIERPTTQSYRPERYIGNRAAGGRTHMAG